MSVKTVTIIGAGIAGLVAALAFARKGVATTLVDQAAALQEVGAGLQMSPNASYVLDQLGILEGLRKVWNEPQSIGLFSGTSLKPIARVPAGQFALERWGSPYGDLHRATLQKYLLEAVGKAPLVKLVLGTRIETEADINAISGGEPDLIVGADGVWSRFRKFIPGAQQPRFSGMVAWRFVIPLRDMPSFLNSNNVTAYLGPSAHFITYPLKEAGFMNLVALSSGSNPGETWSAECSPSHRAEMTAQFSCWHKDIRSLLAYAPKATWWPLFGVPKGRWTDGRKRVLIGDAAHAMTPFAAQGAAMAIEDAFELAGMVSGDRPLDEALAAFEHRRSLRTERVAARGAFNRFAYHARGPFRFGRDIVLSLRKPESIAADLDWLYGYRAAG